MCEDCDDDDHVLDLPKEWWATRKRRRELRAGGCTCDWGGAVKFHTPPQLFPRFPHPKCPIHAEADRPWMRVPGQVG